MCSDVSYLKVVDNMEEIEGAFNSAGREAMEAFGRAECYVEKFLTHPFTY